jgi:hypothetical protein
MGLPKVVYNAGSGNVVLQFVRGPQDFLCYLKARVHDNVATSGIKERVVEAQDSMIKFGMGCIRVSDDLVAWSAFMAYALMGGTFDFYPNSAINEHYHCVSDDEEFAIARTAPGQYSATLQWRIVPDTQAPAGGPAQVMKRFYGISS